MGNKLTKTESLCICIGLLLITSPTLLNDWFTLPYFFRGMLAGFGFSLEIGGLVLIRRRKRIENIC